MNEEKWFDVQYHSSEDEERSYFRTFYMDNTLKTSWLHHSRPVNTMFVIPNIGFVTYEAIITAENMEEAGKKFWDLKKNYITDILFIQKHAPSKEEDTNGESQDRS